MALIPLLWLALIRNREAARWWIAGAFAVSWCADTLAHFTDPVLISIVYPMSQAGIIGAVLLDRFHAKGFVLTLMLIGLATVLSFGTKAPDVFLRTVAWLGIVGIVLELPIGRLRIALLTYFGCGWLTWLLYLSSPNWGTWEAYQASRALGIALFCWANLRSYPTLRLARGHS